MFGTTTDKIIFYGSSKHENETLFFSLEHHLEFEIFWNLFASFLFANSAVKLIFFKVCDDGYLLTVSLHEAAKIYNAFIIGQ